MSRPAPVSRSTSAARVAADAGLLISCASPAASVPRATSDSRCRAMDSKARAEWKTPSRMCSPNGNRSVDQRAQRRRRHPEQPAGRAGRGRWRSRRRARPRPGSRRPTGRAGPWRPAGSPPGRPCGPGPAPPRPAPTRSRPARPRGTPRRRGRSRPRRRGRPAAAAPRRSSPRRAAAPGRRRAARLHRRQVAVDEVDRHRTLAHGGRDPLHRVEPHVAGREHAGHAGLERERRAGERPGALGRGRAGPAR